MRKRPQDTSAEEPNGGNLHVRLRRGPERGNRPGLLNKYLILLIPLGLVGCSVYSPDAGHEIVLIEKPWIFGHGGVDADPVKPGRTFAAITTEGVDVYMQPQKFDTEMHDTMTSDGVPISFHAIVVLQVTDSVVLIKNFGANWYQNNLEEQFKTMVRQA